MRLLVILGLILGTALAHPATATAGEKAGVTMPDTLSVGKTRLVLNGMGLREATFFKVDVYVAGLYLESPSSDATSIIRSKQTKILVLKFVRNVGRSDILKAWHEGFQHNAVIALPLIQREMDQLDAWTPKFKKGDTLRFIYQPDKGVQVDINYARKGTLKGEHFAQSLFAIWLGKHPPTSALKSGMLGNHGRHR